MKKLVLFIILGLGIGLASWYGTSQGSLKGSVLDPEKKGPISCAPSSSLISGQRATMSCTIDADRKERLFPKGGGDEIPSFEVSDASLSFNPDRHAVDILLTLKTNNNSAGAAVFNTFPSSLTFKEGPCSKEKESDRFTVTGSGGDCTLQVLLQGLDDESGEKGSFAGGLFLTFVSKKGFIVNDFLKIPMRKIIADEKATNAVQKGVIAITGEGGTMLDGAGKEQALLSGPLNLSVVNTLAFDMIPKAKSQKITMTFLLTNPAGEKFWNYSFDFPVAQRSRLQSLKSDIFGAPEIPGYPLPGIPSTAMKGALDPALSGQALPSEYIPPPIPRCGDSQKEPWEQCDDGNMIDGDGCSSMCQAEYCGDYLIQSAAGEECDDGNFMKNDGCSARCTKE